MAIQIEQHLFRRRAERMLAEVQAIELRKTSWQEAQAKVKQWGGDRELEGPCNERRCFVRITLNNLVIGYVFERNIFLRLDDYLYRRWRLELTNNIGPFQRASYSFAHAYARAGGRPAVVVAIIGMRDGIVWNKGIWVSIWTYASGGPWTSANGERVEYTLRAGAHSFSRFNLIGDRQSVSQLAFHPNYEIGQPNGCVGCVEGWVGFTPYAAPPDVRRLMQFDLSCLTRWHPCLNQNDIMPAAWSQHLAESSRMDATPSLSSCPTSAVEMAGRDSAHLAFAEVLEYQEKVDSLGYREGAAKVRVLERLKGVTDWRIGEIRDVPIALGGGKTSLKIRSGSRMILIAGLSDSERMRIDPGFGCPVLSANESTLEQLRRGIMQDYGAMDNQK